jgi:hypothetical protein
MLVKKQSQIVRANSEVGGRGGEIIVLFSRIWG